MNGGQAVTGDVYEARGADNGEDEEVRFPGACGKADSGGSGAPGSERTGRAYYLGGYAVECAIKACIIKKLKNSDEWQDRNFSELCYKHELVVLLRLADLETPMNAMPEVLNNWGLVKPWKETSRYDLGRSVGAVQNFLDAIDDPNDGVLTWIKGHW